MAEGRGFEFLAGLVIGGLAGVAATIAFGPELDEETRQRLREESAHWRERAAELTATTRAQTESLLGRGRELLKQQQARLQEAIAESKLAAAEKQRELQAKFEQAQREGEAQL